MLVGEKNISQNMSLKAIRIENALSYKLNPKRAKRSSHKSLKKWRNRKQRRRIHSDNEYIPKYNKYDDWEY